MRIHELGNQNSVYLGDPDQDLGATPVRARRNSPEVAPPRAAWARLAGGHSRVPTPAPRFGSSQVGEALEKRVKSGGRLPRRESTEILAQFASHLKAAIDHSHERAVAEAERVVSRAGSPAMLIALVETAFAQESLGAARAGVVAGATQWIQKRSPSGSELAGLRDLARLVEEASERHRPWVAAVVGLGIARVRYGLTGPAGRDILRTVSRPSRLRRRLDDIQELIAGPRGVMTPAAVKALMHLIRCEQAGPEDARTVIRAVLLPMTRYSETWIASVKTADSRFSGWISQEARTVTSRLLDMAKELGEDTFAVVRGALRDELLVSVAKGGAKILAGPGATSLARRVGQGFLKLIGRLSVALNVATVVDIVSSLAKRGLRRFVVDQAYRLATATRGL